MSSVSFLSSLFGYLKEIGGFSKMAQCFVKFICAIVLLFVVNMIAGGPVKYVSEKGLCMRNEVFYTANTTQMFISLDLMVNLTYCKVPKGEWKFKLDDISQQSDEMTTLTVFGRTSRFKSLIFILEHFSGLMGYSIGKRKEFQLCN